MTTPAEFVLDKNLELPTDQKPWSDVLTAAGLTAQQSSDLVWIDEVLAEHEPEVAYVPTADFHRLVGKGDSTYHGLAIATSKYTGLPTQRSLLVVRSDDPATRLDDLADAKYGYINKSCSSSYFPPAILLAQQNKTLADFLDITPVAAWQGQIDAVVDKQVRATMVLEDVWKSSAKNRNDTKVIGHFDDCKPPVVVVRDDVSETTRKTLLDALVTWTPSWDAIYGAFRPYYYADVQSFFHDLETLPANT